MYLPKAYAETDVALLHERIRAYPFGTLVTSGARGLVADFLPFVVAQDGPFGTLRGHVARGNPLWNDANPGVDVLAVFSGPEAYITPSWYPGKKVDGKVVPTWNYAVAHARGPLRVHADPAWLRAHLEKLVAHNEAAFPLPWKVSDAPDDFIAKMLTAIVGIEIPVRTLTGKWKMSQNRSELDRDRVADGLRALGGEEKAAVADLVLPR